jgi:hypothetical protein
MLLVAHADVTLRDRAAAADDDDAVRRSQERVALRDATRLAEADSRRVRPTADSAALPHLHRD